MAESSSHPRTFVIAAIVIGVIVVGLGAFLLIGLLQGDDPDINEQNGKVVMLSR